MKYFFPIYWPYPTASGWHDDENRMQRETFELLKKNRQNAPFPMEVYLVDLGHPQIFMVWNESQMNYLKGTGRYERLWGSASVIKKWVKESTGGHEYQDANILGPRSHGIEGFSGFKGVIDSFRTT